MPDIKIDEHSFQAPRYWSVMLSHVEVHRRTKISSFTFGTSENTGRERITKELLVSFGLSLQEKTHLHVREDSTESICTEIVHRSYHFGDKHSVRRSKEYSGVEAELMQL
jgi:hypothetical protein